MMGEISQIIQSETKELSLKKTNALYIRFYVFKLLHAINIGYFKVTNII